MGMFVSLEVNHEVCLKHPEGCRECVQICPVDIFVLDERGLAVVVPDNEDECILCDQCLERCPAGAVTLRRHY